MPTCSRIAATTRRHEPANKVPAVYDSAFEVLAHYEACATDCDAACGDACTKIEDGHVEWLQRRYAIGFRRSGGGRLRSGNECVGLDASLVGCDTAPSWLIDLGRRAAERQRLSHHR